MAQSRDDLTSRAVPQIDGETPEIPSTTDGLGMLQELASLFKSGPQSQSTGYHDPAGDSTRSSNVQSDKFDIIYRVLAQQIPAVVFVAFLDEGMGQAYVSPHIEAILGFSQSEWLEDPVRWYRHLHPDDKQRWSIEAAQMLLSGEPVQSVYRVIARDGRVVWLHCDARMLRHENGEPWLIHGVAFDITELKRSQQELEKAREELETRVRERTNDLAKTVAALEVEIGERQRAQEAVQQLNLTLEGRVLERTEELNKMNARLLQDIEERKSLERQLLHAQKMESIGTLAGGIAHDFNNILNIIQAYSYTLAESSAQKDVIADSTMIIQDAVRRGTALVQQLLMIGRKTEPKLTTVNLDTIIEDLMGLLRQTMPRTIELDTELSAPLPMVKVDTNQISQLLLNLCINARDAMPQGGKLSIRAYAGVKSTQHHTPGQFVCLEVSDTGSGMDENVQRRIFEPFFTTKKPGHGTGLGLSLAYAIMENHGGSICVESAPMRGTTFRLYLPVAPSEQEKLPSHAADGASSAAKEWNGRGTILLVEDEQLMVSLLHGMLSQKGYHVLVALDGESAIEIFQRHKHEIDAVLLDVGLPRVSGWEVFLQMQKEKPEVKAVIVSGYLEPDLRHRMQNAGISYVIAKPYVPDDVIEALETLSSAP